MAEPIRIGLVFPQLLGTYGDRGNAEVLAWRLRRRGHRAQVVELPAPGAIPAGLDAYMLGGGEDLNQAAAVKLLLGTTYLDGAGRRVPGLHLLDLETVAAGARCVGEVVARLPDGSLLTGFENHGGRTRLGGTAEPLATVLRGHGNNGDDGTEGIRKGNLVATYLHGPVLARNPALADALATAVLERRGDAAALEPIDPDPGQVLHDARLRAAGFGPPDGGGRRGIPRWRRQRRGSRRWRPPSSRGRAR